MGDDKVPIYSIGHGSRSIETFMLLLSERNINYVIDVRTKPASRFNPQYNKDSFSHSLKTHGFRYVYMGDSLGGRPLDASCYDEDGRVNYTKVMEKEFFINGIRRLESAYRQNLVVACVCSEVSPCDCHRSKLIGVMLGMMEIPMMHINKQGDLESQESVISQVLRYDVEMDLFSDNKPTLRSKKSYL